MRKYTRNFWVRLKPIEGRIKVGIEKKNKIYIYIDPIIAPISMDSLRMLSFVHYHRILLCSSKSIISLYYYVICS